MRIEASFSLNTKNLSKILLTFSLIIWFTWKLRLRSQAKPSSENILTNFSTTSLHDVDDRYRDFHFVLLSAYGGEEQKKH